MKKLTGRKMRKGEYKAHIFVMIMKNLTPSRNGLILLMPLVWIIELALIFFMQAQGGAVVAFPKMSMLWFVLPIR